MAYAVVRLMNDGVSGPSAGIEYQNERDAINWAASQTGHPWDAVTVEVYEDEEASHAMGDAAQTLEIDLSTKIATYA